MPVDYADALDYEASDWPEADWESEFSEAKKRTAARPRNYVPPAQNKGFVTNAAFQTAMDKVRADQRRTHEAGSDRTGRPCARRALHPTWRGAGSSGNPDVRHQNGGSLRRRDRRADVRGGGEADADR